VARETIAREYLEKSRLKSVVLGGWLVAWAIVWMFAWIVGLPNAADAAGRNSFSVFVGKDRRLQTISISYNLPPGDTYLTEGTVSVTLISPVNYKLQKLSNGDSYYLDRTYVLTSIFAAINNRVWIVGNDADQSATSESFLQFEISDTARVYILYDGYGVPPTWLTSRFTKQTQTVTTTNPIAETFVVYMAVIPKGTVRLGGNEGMTSDAKCNYVAIVRRPVAGDLGSNLQIATTQMVLPRVGHRLAILNSGKALIAGGMDSLTTLVTGCELYDSATQSFTATGALLQGRIDPTVIKLNDGRVLAMGGNLYGSASVSEGGGRAPGVPALSTCEIYDPGPGTWSATADMGWKRRMPEAIKLADGRIFVSGGVDDTDGFGLRSTEVFDPSTLTWTAGPSMSVKRYGHRMGLLPDGRVLISGGLWHGPDLVDYATASCEIYDPSTNSLSAGPSMATARGRFGFVSVGGGQFLAMGGLWYQEPSPPATNSLYASVSEVELYDATTNTWTPKPSLPRGMYDFAVASPDAGRAMIFDGFDVQGTDAGQIILYDPNFNTWTEVGNLVTSRSFPFSNGSQMVVDLGGKDYFLCGGTHLDESTGQTTLLYTGERFRY